MLCGRVPGRKQGHAEAPDPDADVTRVDAVG